MKIGIDLDNTIINYDTSFITAAKERGYINSDFCGSKNAVREVIRSQTNGEIKWQKLQGIVYGQNIQKANLFAGVKRFLTRAKLLGCSCYIVSHKTAFGHFDETKTNLHEAAERYLYENGISPKLPDALVQGVFFEITRTAKLYRIRELEFDIFIDDLREVLTHNLFPKKTQPILFNELEINENEELMRVSNMQQLSLYLFGPLQAKEFQFAIPAHADTAELTAVEGRGNSSIYKLQTGLGETFCIKLYPDEQDKSRMNREYDSLSRLKSFSTPTVRPIAKDENLSAVAFEWLDGVELRHPTKSNIDAAIQFLRSLVAISKKGVFDDMSAAAAACFSGTEIEAQFDTRLAPFLSIGDPELIALVRQQLLPLKEKLSERAKKIQGDLEFNRKIGAHEKTVSPSDFGFHNCLQQFDGNLTFFDFEYFGWDDPVKLISDFYFNLGMELSQNLKSYWISSAVDLYGFEIKRRLLAQLPLYGCFWVLINLNEFRSEVWGRRVGARPSLSGLQHQQMELKLASSQKIIKSVEDSVVVLEELLNGTRQ